MKKFVSMIVCMLLAICSVFSLVGCNDGGKGDELVIWTFTDEVKTMVEKYYKTEKPEAKIKVTVFEVNDMATKLDNVLRSKKNLPDVVAIEQRYIRKYATSGKLLDLSDMDSKTGEMYNFTKEAAKNNDGKVVAYAWQANPGVMYYRADMAKDILGVNNPDEMQSKVSTWTEFMKTAKLLKDANTEKFKDVRILSDNTAPARVIYSNRTSGWIKIDDEGKETLVIDPVLYEGENNLLDIVKALEVGDGEWGNTESYKPYINRNIERQSGWFADMSSDNVFSYLLPSYSLNYDFARYAKETKGKWAICNGPQEYTDGGTWLGIVKGSNKVESAKELIEYFTMNAEFLKKWAEDTGDFINNKTLMDQFANDSSKTHEVLADGQNQYKIFNRVAKNISCNNLTVYDSEFCESFKTWCINYAKIENLADTSKENAKKNALDAFISEVTGNYMDIIACPNPLG